MRGTISFFRKISDSPPGFDATPVFRLKHRSIFHPDGLAFSNCGGWLTVADHGKHSVAVFRRDDKRNGTGALAFRRRPVAVIADRRFRYPHSLAFTPQTNHLLVTNAGANDLCAYAPERRWFGRTGWSRAPVAQLMVHDDAAFKEVNTAVSASVKGCRRGRRWAPAAGSPPRRGARTRRSRSPSRRA